MADIRILKETIIKKLVNQELTTNEASKLLNLSTRQVRRLKVKFKTNHSLEHGQSNNNKQAELKEIATEFLKDKYFDFGPTFASEQLEKNENIILSPETTRSLMIKQKLWIPKSRKSTKTFQRRQRKDQYGEMIQFDGSYHLWFENRAPKCCLLVAVDDATGKLMKLTFCNDEGVVNVMTFWKQYISKYGKPISVYLDNFSTYKVNTPSAKLKGELTQFERAMEADLNINIINALTPQAKGRIERMNKTLQDRLVKELRISNINTKTEANIFVEQIFIPHFNTQFEVQPLNPKDIHTPFTKQEIKKLNNIFSIQTKRIVSNDLVIRHKNICYQILRNQQIFTKDKVTIEEHFDKTIKIQKEYKYLKYVIYEEPIKRLESKGERVWKQVPNSHPWRKFHLAGSHN